MQPDDIYLAGFPFGGGGGMKLRPVLLLTNSPVGSVPEVLVAYISSVAPPTLLPSDVLLDPMVAQHSSTNLKIASVLRLHKLATIHRRMIVRRLGVLSPMASAEVDRKLRELLGL